jgi:aminopeptidase
MGTYKLAKRLLKSAKIENQKLVVVTDNYELAIGEAFLRAGKEITNTNFYNLDSFGHRPLFGVPEKIMKDLEDADLLISIIQKISDVNTDEYLTVRSPLTNLKQKNPKLRIGQLLSITEEQFNEIFSYDPKEVRELNNKIFNLIQKSKKVHITTPAGTDIECEISKDMLWINQDADLSKPNLTHSLLAGEVYGVPKNFNGVAVIDGVLGGEFMEFGSLEKNPLKIILENNKIKHFECNNKELEERFRVHLKKYENADLVGELGFGTNTSLTKLYGVLGIDEKFPGNHLAFGHPYSEKTGAKWSSKTHIDGVMQKCSTWIDDVQVLRNGKYII